MKKFAKNLVGSILGWQVRRLREHNNFKVIAVSGSIGKTSTKFAVSSVLSQAYKVHFQAGNLNDLVSVPSVFLGYEYPNIFNPFAWIKIFWQNEKVVRQPFPHEIVVVEYSIDGPGQMKRFDIFGQVDMSILTAVTPEHMEFFADLDAVAREEISIASFSNQLIVNRDLIEEDFLRDLPHDSITYGVKQPSDVRMTGVVFNNQEASFDIVYRGAKFLHAQHEQITEPQLYSVCAATAVAIQLNMTPHAIEQGIRQIKPVSGRMQHLAGFNHSTIIDDTYNASSEAMLAALDTLYRMEAPQKIAVLGNMNELGGYAGPEHNKVGKYCDPRELDLVVTIGPDANKYLAAEARDKGCHVESFDDPYSVADYLRQVIKEGAVVLIKGSQNRVFLEEAVKLLLADPADAKKLVRQSPDWLKTKQKAFGTAR